LLHTTPAVVTKDATVLLAARGNNCLLYLPPVQCNQPRDLVAAREPLCLAGKQLWAAVSHVSSILGPTPGVIETIR